jgi:hypothetical protein
VLRLRAAQLLTNNDCRGLYVSDDQIDAILHQGASNSPALPNIAAIAVEAERLHVSTHMRQQTLSLPIRSTGRWTHLRARCPSKRGRRVSEGHQIGKRLKVTHVPDGRPRLSLSMTEM